MTAAKWTPGRAIVMSGMSHVYVATDAGEIICRVDADGDEPEHEHLVSERAHLIAAAPDMAEALEVAASAMEIAAKHAQPREASFLRVEAEVARTALAKARGEEPKS